MARPRNPARLVWDDRRQVWAIADFIDGERYKRRTRHGRDARAAAEAELALHIAEQARLAREAAAIAPSHDDPANSNPRLVSVPACLTFYGGRMEGTANAQIVGQHIEHLLRHLGKYTLAQIRGDVCRAYAEARLAEPYTRRGWKTWKLPKPATIRRELVTLSAAVNLWHAEYNLASVPKIVKPPDGKAHPDWLTEREFERLLKAAQGYRWVSSDLATREPIWERIEGVRDEIGDLLVRFLLIGFYSGTRSAAVLNLRWRRHRTAGFVDLPGVTLFREGPEAPESRKRQPPCRIHDRLVPYLQAWREADLKAGVARVVHRNGAPVLRVSKGFRLAAVRACLDRRDVDGTYRVRDLAAGLSAAAAAEDGDEGYMPEDDEDADELGWPSPHILRHTRATLMLRAGVPPVEVAEYLGMSLAMLLKVYGHTAAEYQRAAAAA
ncbi:integrase [Methylorubrum sp. DB1722]|uniref:tyrosine-type recombinase/integrase n=1 Tax=Methylorubrum sp. DB1722 TaxID=2478916 RepID=UPI0018E2D047|nr:integrase [Methylorubrum sp. DB1722]MBI1689555.1 integrase [Methylorubrum sp. DB1722]